MENTTKALLMAAAVLIVILIIAFGIKIFNSTSNTSGQALNVGSQISEKTDEAAGILGSIFSETNSMEDLIKNNASIGELSNLLKKVTNYNTDNSEYPIYVYIRSSNYNGITGFLREDIVLNSEDELQNIINDFKQQGDYQFNIVQIYNGTKNGKKIEQGRYKDNNQIAYINIFAF